MSNPTSTLTYPDLQNTLDKVVGKIGLSSTVLLLDNVVDNSGIAASHIEKMKLITAYITSRCQVVFDLEDLHFFDSPLRDYRDGRMACYHLVKKYTDGSYTRIAEQFAQKKRNVMYYCQKCEQILTIPQHHRVLAEKYRALEKETLEFITILSKNNL